MMKKNLLIFGVCFFVLFLFCGQSFAEQKVQSTSLIGKFALEKADWDKLKESQLFESIRNAPENSTIDIIGHTDRTGPDSINIPLSQERADLVAEKIKCILPKANVISRGYIYNKKDGHDVDYRMVRVTVSYNSDKVVFGSLLKNINSSLKELKIITKEASDKLGKIKNNQSSKALELALLQINQDIATQSQNLYSKLGESQFEIEKSLEKSRESFKNYLDVQDVEFFLRLKEQSDVGEKRIEALNDSITKILESIKSDREYLKSDSQLSQKEYSGIQETLSGINFRISSLEKMSKENSIHLNSKAKKWMTVLLVFQVVIVILSAVLVYYARKKKM